MLSYQDNLFTSKTAPIVRKIHSNSTRRYDRVRSSQGAPIGTRTALHAHVQIRAQTSPVKLYDDGYADNVKCPPTGSRRGCINGALELYGDTSAKDRAKHDNS